MRFLGLDSKDAHLALWDHVIRGVMLWQAYLDRTTCKYFCDLEFAVIYKVSV